jgi:hypothetical protein
MTVLKVISLNILLIFSQAVFSAENIPLPPYLDAPDKSNQTSLESAETPPPELPEADSRNIPEPEVRIIRKKDTVIEEYRVNGRLRFVKITPTVGKAYYMVDTNGDGILETRENDLDNPPINRWILLEW